MGRRDDPNIESMRAREQEGGDIGIENQFVSG